MNAVNYLAEGTQNVLRAMARAAAQGVAEGIRPPQNTPTEQK